MEKQSEPAPASANQEIIVAEKPLPKITVFTDWCKQCGICVTFCPQQVLAMDENRRVFAQHPEKCIACHMCELRCPDFAITVKEPVEKIRNNGKGGNA